MTVAAAALSGKSEHSPRRRPRVEQTSMTGEGPFAQVFALIGEVQSRFSYDNLEAHFIVLRGTSTDAASNSCKVQTFVGQEMSRLRGIPGVQFRSQKLSYFAGLFGVTATTVVGMIDTTRQQNQIHIGKIRRELQLALYPNGKKGK